MKHRLNGLDFYIIYCIIAVILFTIAEFISSSLTGITHDTLCTAFFGFHGGEIFCACLIKRLKLKKETSNE